MNFKIKDITDKGRAGKINLEIENIKFSWDWEFGSGKYVVIISVPNQKEWEEIFGNIQINRESCLSEISEEIINLKCKNCTYRITDNEISLLSE